MVNFCVKTVHIEVYKKEHFPSSRNYLGELNPVQIIKALVPRKTAYRYSRLAHLYPPHLFEGVYQATVILCGLCIKVLHLQSKECTGRTTAIPNNISHCFYV